MIFISSVTHRDMECIWDHQHIEIYNMIFFIIIVNNFTNGVIICYIMNTFSNSNLRIVGKYIDNLPSYLNNITLFLNILIQELIILIN